MYVPTIYNVREAFVIIMMIYSLYNVYTNISRYTCAVHQINDLEIKYRK